MLRAHFEDGVVPKTLEDLDQMGLKLVFEGKGNLSIIPRPTTDGYQVWDTHLKTPLFTTYNFNQAVGFCYGVNYMREQEK